MRNKNRNRFICLTCLISNDPGVSASRLAEVGDRTGRGQSVRSAWHIHGISGVVPVRRLPENDALPRSSTPVTQR